MPVFLALINLPSIITPVDDTSDRVLVKCNFLLYPVVHLLSILFSLSSKAKTQKPASDAISRQVSPANGCGPMQL